MKYFINLKFKTRGIAFIIVGSTLFIPGFYYSWTLFLVWKSQNPFERLEILEVFSKYIVNSLIQILN